MAVITLPYPGVNKSLPYLKKQVLHSVIWCNKNTPPLKTPLEIWNYCKSRYTFKNDPVGVELFQTVPTLLSNKVTPPGHGDCDDATIFVLTLMFINGLEGGFVLAGRHTVSPSHIYAYCDYQGKRYILDLTNKKFNYERYYPYKQYIPLTIPKKQIQMLLQLADRPRRLGATANFKRLAAIRRKAKAEAERRRQEIKNKILQGRKEAEARRDKLRAYRMRMRRASSIFLPSKNVHIPASHFDKIPQEQVNQMLLSEGYSPEQLSELSGWRERREARRKERAERRRMRFELRMEKKRARIENIRARAEKKRARAELLRQRGLAKVLRAKAKQTRAERGGGGGGGFFKNLFKGGGGGGEEGGEEQPQEEEAQPVEAEEVPQEEGAEQMPEQTEGGEGENLEEGNTVNILGMQVNKTAAIITGGALLITAAYMLNKKRR